MTIDRTEKILKSVPIGVRRIEMIQVLVHKPIGERVFAIYLLKTALYCGKCFFVEAASRCPDNKEVAGLLAPHDQRFDPMKYRFEVEVLYNSHKMAPSRPLMVIILPTAFDGSIFIAITAVSFTTNACPRL